MRAFIHYSGGEPFNEECAAAERGFESLGVSCVPFSTNEELDRSLRDDVVVAGMLVTQHALSQRGVIPPEIDYPEAFAPILGRRIWQRRADLIREDELPLFVKPLAEKDLPATVVRAVDDLSPYLRRGEGYALHCSDPVELVSEWRVFVRYGAIVGVSCYRGSAEVLPDVDTVERSVESYGDEAPHGYAADFGVTADGETVLVEVNDGYSLGCYGLNPVAYALLLSARWAELVGLEDPLHCVVRERHSFIETQANDPSVEELLRLLIPEVEGSTEAFCSVALTLADNEGVGCNLASFLKEKKRSVGDVWQWFAGELSLETHAVGGKEYIFPRYRSVRFFIDKSSPEPLGSSSLKQYDPFNASVSYYLKEGSRSVYERLCSLILGYAEEDALALGCAKVFTLAEENDPDDPVLAACGYSKAAKKDDDRLAEALGAYIIYDHIMEKNLGSRD